MPSTRRRRARGRRLPELSLAMVDRLLGQPRPIAEIHALLAAGREYDQWLEFDDIPAATIEALIAAHRPTLVREARRRGVLAPWERADVSTAL